MNSSEPNPSTGQPRRGFLQLVTAALGGLVALLPALAGLRVFLDPLGKKSAQGDFTKVASLANVPDDGVPRQFPVIADKKDAWTFFPKQRIGAVFLRRKPGETQPQCFTSICPHAGCAVSFASETSTYNCPCHSSKFDIEGGRIDPTPSPRDLDPLDVEVNDNGEVLVRYTSFYLSLIHI